jgi:hypothetical protein
MIQDEEGKSSTDFSGREKTVFEIYKLKQWTNNKMKKYLFV